jgi:hypothetical protein
MKAIYLLTLLLITSSVQADGVDIPDFYDDPLAYSQIADPDPLVYQYISGDHTVCSPGIYELVKNPPPQVPGPSLVTMLILAALVLTLTYIKLNSRFKEVPIKKKSRRGVRPYHRLYCYRT